MQENDPLQRAIATARAGHELTARDMFLDIVKAQPQNELAWMWLTGLLDNLEDCIYACERTLEINPNNAPARQYLSQLLVRKKKESEDGMAYAEEQARAVREGTELNKQEVSLDMIRNLTRKKYVSPDAWRLLAERTPDMSEQIHALEKLLELAPDDAKALSELRHLKHLKENPLDLAALYEEQGNINGAIRMYSLAAQNPNLKKQWNKIYWKIVGLENLELEKIAHISPAVSITRLTFGPLLLYSVLLLIQVGINPIAYPEFGLWLGLPVVGVGGFMIALASVQSHNRIWSVLFKSPGASATTTSRFAMAVIGWVLVLFSYAFLFLSAVFRFWNGPLR